jgi:hypothetical protein
VRISDLVGAILYLQSAGFVTGKILHVHGGQSVGLTSSLSHIAPNLLETVSSASFKRRTF